ncbi:hypothetical protein Aglo03_22130 [Actinokineospora globicatena]|uniref:Uncharacterized protein n=1 Tax=Actinokineospora globicatena TaxID=103729 RepID=A0A9W6V7I5_9PSEU|nr:hypothetical protein Aglo03_22130 [Actinokineospora globicatena]
MIFPQVIVTRAGVGNAPSTSGPHGPQMSRAAFGWVSGGTGAGPGAALEVGPLWTPPSLTTIPGRTEGPAVQAASRTSGSRETPRPTLTPAPSLSFADLTPPPWQTWGEDAVSGPRAAVTRNMG